MNPELTRILIVEDNLADAALIREHLRESFCCDFELTHVSRASAARPMLQGQGQRQGQVPRHGQGQVPDLILADLGLPDAQGIESFRLIHAMAPTIPIVVLTGLHDEAMGLLAVREGAQDYLSKSTITGPLLARTIRYAIQRHRSENALRVIAHAVSAKTGEQFFRTLVEQLAATLEVELVFLSEIADPALGQAKTLAAWVEGKEVPNFVWSWHNEPARRVVARSPASLDQPDAPDSSLDRAFGQGTGLATAFPNARLVREFRADSYLGVPLLSSDGQVRGLLEVASKHPLPDTSVFESTLRIFAARASGELERAHAIAAIGEWKSRYESAILASGQILYDWDAVTHSIIWGGNTDETLGYTAEELATHTDWLSLVHPDDRKEYLAELDRSLEFHTSFHLEYRVRHRLGHNLSVEDNGYFRRDSRGGTDLMIGFIADITERKRLEDQLRHSQKMDAIGQLAGGLAHDFRNLLMAINGHISLAQAAIPRDHPVQESLAQIAEASQQAGGITNALLTFTHKSPTLKQPVQLTTIVEQAARLFRRTLPANIILEVRTGTSEPWVNADATQIQQAVMNLAINAADAMPKGGTLTVTIDTLPFDPDIVASSRAGVVRLVVRDTGLGMSPEIKDRIFEPYFTTKPRGQGTGLGLSITHSILKEHGGQIKADSELGKGTAFTILLPAIEPSCRRTDAPAPSISRVGSGRTAMVACAHSLVRSVVASMLATSGFSVLQAETGQAALGFSRERRDTLSLLVLDLDSCTHEVGDLAGAIRSQMPHLELLFITSQPESFTTSDPLTRVLRKPFQVTDLAAALADLAQARGSVAVV